MLLGGFKSKNKRCANSEEACIIIDSVAKVLNDSSVRNAILIDGVLFLALKFQNALCLLIRRNKCGVVKSPLI